MKNGPIQKWLKHKKWTLLPFQQEMLDRYPTAKGGILNAPTGSGKTFAMFLPALAEWMAQNSSQLHASSKSKNGYGLQILWITPLRALAKDIRDALQAACDDMGIPWQVEIRTGDTSASVKQRQKNQMPEVLITTPESVHVLFSQKGYADVFKTCHLLVVDEWHELIGSKRGTQVELIVSRLKTIAPDIRVWGISATIGNLEQAREVLLPISIREQSCMIRATHKKKVRVHTVLPDTVERYSWAGHIGLLLFPKTVEIIKNSSSTILFTNVRSQAEIWFQRFFELAPDLAKDMGLHHGSMNKETRLMVEEKLHNHGLKAVVATSSLDLGVDFRPVDTVIQVGSPKGVARFLQRAGRSGHRPDAESVIHFLPTNTLEIVESAALQEAIRTNTIESRPPVEKPMDVLLQYLVTLAVSDGFEKELLFREITATYAYRDLTREELEWLIVFVTKGGAVLSQYPQYRKVAELAGQYKVTDRRIALQHKMSIGTIVSDEIMSVRFVKGGSLGVVEESFISQLKTGDVFWFAGRSLRLVRIREMTAFVEKAPGLPTTTPRWMGGRISLSSSVAHLIRKKITEAAEDRFESLEMKALQPLFSMQKKESAIPTSEELLIEIFEAKDGWHLFFYPFEGRLVHEGLSALFAHRIAVTQPVSFSIAMNDYGFELLTEKGIDIEHLVKTKLLRTDHLREEILASINGAEMAKRKFRDIAQIAGLIFTGYPGKSKRAKHLQASSELLFDIFTKYDKDNLLVRQAYREVLENQLDEARIHQVLLALQKRKLVVKKISRPSPFSFPLMVDRLRQQLSSEEVEEQLKRMKLKLGEN